MVGTATQRAMAGGFFFTAAILSLAAGRPGPAVAEGGANRAVVYVDTGSAVTTTCVRFDGEIDGIEALGRAGVDAVLAAFGGMGTAVCSLDGTGCSAAGCLTCQAPDHWQYLRGPAGAGSFALSPVGASTVTIRDGDVEGWVWGRAVSLPPLPSVDAICGPAPTPPPAGAASVPPPSAGSEAQPATGPRSPPAGPDGADPAVAPPASGPPAPAIPQKPPGAGTEAVTTSRPAEPATTTSSTMSLPGASETTVRPDRPGSEVAGRDEADVGTRAAVAEVGSSESPPGSRAGWLGVGTALVLVGGLAGWALVLRRRVDG